MAPPQTDKNKQEFMENQMFLMQSTMKNLASEVTELRQLNTEMLIRLKKMTEPSVGQQSNVPTKATAMVKSPESVRGFIETPAEPVKSASKTNVSMDKIRTTENREALNGLTEAEKYAKATEAPLKINNIRFQTQQESDATIIQDWLSNGLPETPAGVRIILKNVQKCITWKSVVGNSVFYLEKLVKWVKERTLQEMEDSKADLFVDDILKNFTNVIKEISFSRCSILNCKHNILVIARVPRYSHQGESCDPINLTPYRTIITAYIELEKAMNEKKTRNIEVIKLASKALLEIHLAVFDTTVCWRTQQMIYFISGSTKEMEEYTGKEKKLLLKDALVELSSMVKHEELENDFLCYFWLNANKLSGRFDKNMINLSEVYEAACYNFHTSSEDRTCLLGILDYLRSEATKQDSREFMIESQITTKIRVDLTKSSEADKALQFYYAQLLCSLMVSPESRLEELDSNGEEAYLESSRSVFEYCSVRRVALAPNWKLRLMLNPLFNDNEPSNQLFATFLLLSKISSEGEKVLEVLRNECGDDLLSILETMSETECSEEDYIRLGIKKNAKQILKVLKEDVKE